MVSLRRLQHFLVLAEEGAFSRAARRLHLTQPALTRSMQTLEESLGLQLLERRHDGITLTSAGGAMLARAKRVLGEAGAMQSEAEQIRGIEVGQVNFGVGVLPEAVFLEEVLARQAAQRPHLTVHADISSWVRLYERLQRDELDFVVAMTRSLPPIPGYRVIPLPPQHQGYFVRGSHPLAGAGAGEIRARLHAYPLLSPEMPVAAKERIARLFGKPAFDEIGGLRCDNAPMLKRLALRSDVVLFSTRENLQQELLRGEFVWLPVMSEAEGVLDLSLVYPEHRYLSPAARWMMEQIQAYFRE